MVSSRSYHFDARWHETVALADGTEVTLRLVRPEDKVHLRRAFGELSRESRYARFFTHKETLSDEELEALTSLDGVNRLAIGAGTVTTSGRFVPLGVARFVRVPEAPEIADAAVAVIDAYHTRGLGTLLSHRLGAAARERGITRFRCEFFVKNERIRHLIENLAPISSFETDGEVVHVEIPVPETGPQASPAQFDHQAPLQRILGQSAAGAIQVRLRRAILKLKE